jgi:hypothetical protein
MTGDELKRHITATPFRPFRVHVADGRDISVQARDFILLSPSGRMAYVFQPDDSHDVLDVLMITGIHFTAPAGANGQAQSTNP